MPRLERGHQLLEARLHDVLQHVLAQQCSLIGSEDAVFRELARYIVPPHARASCDVELALQHSAQSRWHRR